ncbi:unnamed protein product [Cyclocybe aegerita]|uniref:Uncharacterized protein n=1 Tax=Cyclocybe aegerita TaxID=1973307 RepID=A0A8S0VWL7_CYCAE|nr:unnamed protein product [Cyclocybe aegerita]
MDATLATPRDEAAARHRFENFKLGKSAPSSAPVPGNHGHSRSHSRNKSISNSLPSFSFPVSSKTPSVNDMSHFSFPPSNGTTTAPLPSVPSFSPTTPSFNATSNPAPSTKRNSHHRRRSSVSTRHESAELMGVSLPDLPPSTSDDNINLGEKDSIRRRALWALEGKPDISYNKVEIPDFSAPDVEKMMFDFATKPSLASGSSSGYGNTLMANKRDSFKLLATSSSSKDQLHTLVEEEEEEEEEEQCKESTKAEDSLPSPAESVKENFLPPNTPVTPAPAVAVTKPTPAKHRPSNLNLRPLSLTPDNLITTTQGLPTPTLTPSPRTGLRSLSLSPSPASSEDSIPAESVKQSRRSSLVISPTPASRRPVLNLSMDQVDNSPPSKSDDDQQKPVRRSSISYKRSSTGGGVTLNSAGLPTPEMTPTFGRRYSNAESVNSIGDDEFFPNPPTQSRPLSASEQHFLVKSHHALLARITDLERTLSMRRRESGGYSNGGSSRPLSVASNFSSSSDLASATGSEPPSDEMLNLIADLKAERDELKRDVDGWRQRVNSLESQTAMLAKRIENERRDAWVARSRVGLLEVEKNTLTKRLEAVDELIGLHDQEKNLWASEKKVLQMENEEHSKRVAELEAELASVKKELETERTRKTKEIDPLATPTPRSFDNFSRQALNRKHGLGFMSVDSEASSTEFDPDSSDDGPTAFGFALKSVQESDENYEDEYSEDENGLAGYEDEEDTDMSLQSSSSFDSDDDDAPRTTTHLQQTGGSSPSTPTRPVFTPPRPTHVSRATLSRTWTFPKGNVPQPATPKEEEKEPVDKFFGCLDDESDTHGSVPSSPSSYSYEKSKGLFSSGFKFAPEDDNASFFLPGNIGIPAEEEKGDRRLSTVDEAEEDEDDSDDDDMFGEAGGIRITFTPPQEEEIKEERKQIQLSPVKRTSPPPTLPALDFGSFDDEDETEDLGAVIPISFDRPLLQETEPSPPASPAPASVPVIVTTPPSSIPRPTSPSAHPASPASSMIPRSTSPSSIPRATTSRYSFSAPPNSEPRSPTPPKASPIHAVAASSSFVTPPNKRGGALPSFIPQSVSSPSPIRTMPAPAKPKVVPTSTFIRQPSRKPLLPSVAPKGQSGTNANGSTLIPQIASTFPSMNTATNARSSRRSPDPASIPAASVFDNAPGSSQMKSIDLTHDNTQRHVPVRGTEHGCSRSSASTSTPSIMPTPLVARLSFETLTHFNPFSWTSRTSSASVPSQRPAPSTASHSAASSLSDHTVVGVEAAPRRSGGYVSREKQLRLLKARMEVEGVMVMRTLVDVQCKKCNGEIVYI